MDQIYRAAESPRPVFIDPDTYVSPGTPRALDRLAGAVEEAVIQLQMNEGPVFILGRPPGHHAGRKGPALGAPTLGFCIFNTSALVATLLSRQGRTAVLDFDLHHGNGTQEILWDASILHVDIHQDPSTIYPGTGYPWQRGAHNNLVNILLPPGSGDDIFMDAVSKAFERIRGYDPEYLVVSAGFDAFLGDFAYMRITEAGYGYIAEMLKSLEAGIVVVLEGGYTQGLSRGLPSFTVALLQGEHRPGPHTISEESLWYTYRRINTGVSVE